MVVLIVVLLVVVDVVVVGKVPVVGVIGILLSSVDCVVDRVVTDGCHHTWR